MFNAQYLVIGAVLLAFGFTVAEVAWEHRKSTPDLPVTLPRWLVTAVIGLGVIVMAAGALVIVVLR